MAGLYCVAAVCVALGSAGHSATIVSGGGLAAMLFFRTNIILKYNNYIPVKTTDFSPSMSFLIVILQWQVKLDPLRNL